MNKRERLAKLRTLRVRAALLAYHKNDEQFLQDVGDESAITHLLIDIRHACDNLDLDFYQLLDNSHHHYSEEVTPEGIEEAHTWLSLESLVDDVLPTAVNQ